MGPVVNAGVDGLINANRLKILGASNVEVEAAHREKLGTRMIKTGKATTMFVPNPVGFRKIAQNLNFDLSFDPTYPQDLSGQILWVENYVSKFNMMMTKNGFKPNDFSGGYAFAYALSYEAYYDKKPDPNMIRKIYQENRDLIMNDAFHQGSPDIDKQKMYGNWAIMSTQAIEWREKARVAKAGEDKQSIEKKVKHYANFILEVEK